LVHNNVLKAYLPVTMSRLMKTTMLTVNSVAVIKAAFDDAALG